MGVKHDKELSVAKPSKKDRIALRRENRDKMMDVEMDMPVTLECPKCHVQHKMTLKEYFDEINYEGFRKHILRCELCSGRPELLFYKANHAKIMAAGLNYQRMKEGISKEEMHEHFERVDSHRDKENLEQTDQDLKQLTDDLKEEDDE